MQQKSDKILTKIQEKKTKIQQKSDTNSTKKMTITQQKSDKNEMKKNVKKVTVLAFISAVTF